MSLDGRSFLHSYDYTKDTDGSVLELIMTAPLVVAHWINMQYFASTVDPQHYSSGSKTIHIVVGQFGVVAGNGGDLGIGLPLESFHNGQSDEHQPLRLLGIIAAPKEMISKVIAKHPLLQQIFGNQWMHLIALDGGSRINSAAISSGNRWMLTVTRKRSIAEVATFKHLGVPEVGGAND